MPALGSKLRALALTKTDWDVDAALALLRSFQVSQLDKLNAITKVGCRGCACCVLLALGGDVGAWGCCCCRSCS